MQKYNALNAHAVDTANDALSCMLDSFTFNKRVYYEAPKRVVVNTK